MSPSSKTAKKSPEGFSEEERAAMREAVRERRARPRAGKAEGEEDVLAKISEMRPESRAMAERLHAIIKANAPTLAPRTWYGMPAYARNGEVFVYFRPAEKFKTRYSTLGFSDAAHLDDGHMWPTDFALMDLTDVEEARIIAMVKRALS